MYKLREREGEWSVGYAVAREPFIDAQAPLHSGAGGAGEECGRGEQWPRQGRFLYEKRGPSSYYSIPPPAPSPYYMVPSASTRAFRPEVRYKN